MSCARRRLMGSIGLLVVPTLVILSLRHGADEPTGRLTTLLDRMVEGHGGQAALGRVHSLRMEGTVTTVRGEVGSVVRVIRGPGTLASLIDYGDRAEIRILAEGRGWRGEGHNALTAADAPLLMAMQMHSARLLAPWILNQYRGQAVLLEDDPDAGPLIGLDLGEGRTLRVRLDPVSFRVTWTGSFIPMGGTTLEFTTTYGDFRSVQGLQLAHHEQNTAQRSPTATLVFERLTANPWGDGLLLIPARKIPTHGDRAIS